MSSLSHCVVPTVSTPHKWQHYPLSSPQKCWVYTGMPLALPCCWCIPAHVGVVLKVFTIAAGPRKDEKNERETMHNNPGGVQAFGRAKIHFAPTHSPALHTLQQKKLFRGKIYLRAAKGLYNSWVCKQSRCAKSRHLYFWSKLIPPKFPSAWCQRLCLFDVKGWVCLMSKVSIC